MYSSDAMNACRQVLTDIVHCLRGSADKFYLIGGWSVYHLLDRPDRTPETIGFAGTEDVDLAFLVPMSELEEIMSALRKWATNILAPSGCTEKSPTDISRSIF